MLKLVNILTMMMKMQFTLKKNNILFNYPEFGDRLIIGKFCSIASGTQFIMGSANHRINSVSTYPFAVMGSEWAKRVPDHLAQLPDRKSCHLKEIQSLAMMSGLGDIVSLCQVYILVMALLLEHIVL